MGGRSALRGCIAARSVCFLRSLSVEAVSPGKQSSQIFSQSSRFSTFFQVSRSAFCGVFLWKPSARANNLHRSSHNLHASPHSFKSLGLLSAESFCGSRQPGQTIFTDLLTIFTLLHI